MNICMVGYGSIARAHMRALSRLQPTFDVSFDTVMGRLPEATAEFAREFGFRQHTTDFGEALAAPQIDAVVICSPTDVHMQQAEQALRAGRHVLCEIPLATDLASIDRLIGLADQADRRLMVCHTQRYYPGIVVARRAVAEGRLHVHHLVCRYMFLRRENVNWMGRRRSWTDNLLWHHGCHAVDTALWLLGATEVSVSAHLALPSRQLGIPMDLAIVMRTPRDQLVTIALSYNSHRSLQDYLLIGEEDTLLFDKGTLTSRDGVLYAPRSAGALEDPEADPIAQQDREFLSAVREGREPAVSGRAVRPAMAALQAAQDQFAAWAPPGAVHPL